MKKILYCLAAVALTAACAPKQSVLLSEMEGWDYMISGWETTRSNASITDTPLSIGGVVYEYGLGTHAPSEALFTHDGSAGWFTAQVGLDDNAKREGSIEFSVFTDKGIIFRSGVMKRGDAAMPVQINLKGVRHLCLMVDTAGDGKDYDHADWADARFEAVNIPVPVNTREIVEEPYILTPAASAEPRINGSKIYGVTPGKPFIFRVAATGDRPMKFSAEGLPSSLTLNEETGIITGTSPEKGEHIVTLTASNDKGKCIDKLKIVSGGSLALTPHMGWNSWYIYVSGVTQKNMEDAALAMVQSGMADYGYCFVNIDDGWNIRLGSDDPIIGGEPRNPDGTLRCNAKFPDIMAFTDLVHSLGLKAGTYISPGMNTCAGFAGSLGHEELDAKTFADWGFDFLKYDWCGYGKVPNDGTKEYLIKPYRLMGGLLKEQSRDIIFNLCQYGMGNVWEWGREVGGHSWRTRGDIGGQNLVGNMFSMGFFQETIRDYSGPGGWNDPDYLLFGEIYNFVKGGTKKSDFTPSEQYTCMTLWSILSAPLIFSGDMTRLDDFTKNIICNAEVIEINQDELGYAGKCISNDDLVEVWEKELSDGTFAVAVFNRRPIAGQIRIDWKALGYGNATGIRDLWRQQDVKGIKAISELDMLRHACAFFRMKK